VRFSSLVQKLIVDGTVDTTGALSVFQDVFTSASAACQSILEPTVSVPDGETVAKPVHGANARLSVIDLKTLTSTRQNFAQIWTVAVTQLQEYLRKVRDYSSKGLIG